VAHGNIRFNRDKQRKNRYGNDGRFKHLTH
jgi:hypothetical protein